MHSRLWDGPEDTYRLLTAQAMNQLGSDLELSDTEDVKVYRHLLARLKDYFQSH